MLKCTFLYNQTSPAGRAAGWSETWYLDDTVPNAFTSCDSLAKKRVAMLTGKAAVTNVRIQVLGSKAQIFSLLYPGAYGPDNDIPQMALECSIGNPAVPNVKRFQLRGLPDGIALNGDYQPTGAFTAGLNQWVAQLQGGRFRFKCKDASVPPVQVVAVDANGTFHLSGPMVFAVGNYIQFIRMKNTAGGNVSGTYYVSVKTDAQTGVILGWGGTVVNLSGTARLAASSFPIVDRTTFSADRLTTRKVGRPFFLYRGRVSRRSKRQ